MAEHPESVAFFDIGNTLASVRVTADRKDIESLTVYPEVPPALTELHERGVRLGILSDRGGIPEDRVNAALDRSGLLAHFDTRLVRYGPKNSTLLFEQAAVVARDTGGGSTPTLLFVGEDATERAFARGAGFLVAPHPALATAVLGQRAPLRYLRIRGTAADKADWRALLRRQPLVPLYGGDDPASAELYAVTDAATALRLDDLGFLVDRLGAEDEPLTTDLYLLRDDRRHTGRFGSAVGNAVDRFTDDDAARQVLASSPAGLFVAIPAGRSVESHHFADARHGHHLKLRATPALLADHLAAAPAAGPAATDLTPAERDHLTRCVTADGIRREVERYTGARPASGTVTIRSRHIHHPDNATAVRTLLADATAAGRGRLRVRTHAFAHEGRTYENVEAVLPGSGPTGVVLVSAHLDSTGARQPGYRAALDPAPGADDDGSGVAGVLCAARAVLALSASDGVPRREIRFVLFNAEEHGLVGSHAYARDEARLGTDIVAVFQLDMIGHDVRRPATFELHAGFTPSASVQGRSLRLAELVAATAARMSPSLPEPQIHPGADGGRDPAEQRSDHHSFQLHGYAACLATEDFFAGPGPFAPDPEPNPNYHLPADTTINARYASDITRAVTAAAWISATRR
ncbi:M28 family peptidase [Streptomyces sp. NPDC057877]|uniref:M28 family peptidase n=1 Tax=Streptomyces sp. NPDC057877 TaxID=3346269 RepID=UPI003696C318